MKSTKPEIMAQISRLEAFYDKNLNEEKITTYVETLIEFPIHLVSYAMDRSRRRYKYFPSLDELLGIIEEAQAPKNNERDQDPVPCDRCGGCGFLQVFTMLEFNRRHPNAPIWVFKGIEFVEYPHPDATRMVAKCNCENSRRVSGLPEFKGEGRPPVESELVTAKVSSPDEKGWF